ncbi:Protein of unknown function [Gryllus bimaculatus]|nr:Protein of unknown function [Gryllus bimaculatus]
MTFDENTYPFALLDSGESFFEDKTAKLKIENTLHCCTIKQGKPLKILGKNWRVAFPMQSESLSNISAAKLACGACDEVRGGAALHRPWTRRTPGRPLAPADYPKLWRSLDPPGRYECVCNRAEAGGRGRGRGAAAPTCSSQCLQSSLRVGTQLAFWSALSTLVLKHWGALRKRSDRGRRCHHELGAAAEGRCEDLEARVTLREKGHSVECHLLRPMTNKMRMEIKN